MIAFSQTRGEFGIKYADFKLITPYGSAWFSTWIEEYITDAKKHSIFFLHRYHVECDCLSYLFTLDF